MIMLFFRASFEEGAEFPRHIVGRWLGWDPRTEEDKAEEAKRVHLEIAGEALHNLIGG